MDIPHNPMASASTAASITEAEAALSSALEAAGQTAHALAARDIGAVNAQRDQFLAAAEAARGALLAAVGALERAGGGGGGSGGPAGQLAKGASSGGEEGGGGVGGELGGR